MSCSTIGTFGPQVVVIFIFVVSRSFDLEVCCMVIKSGGLDRGVGMVKHGVSIVTFKYAPFVIGRGII